MILATVFVPAGTTLIANTTITDIRDRFINLNTFVNTNLPSGQHTLQVKAFTDCGTISNISIFNLFISIFLLVVGKFIF